jgi:hypothetical protein
MFWNPFLRMKLQFSKTKKEQRNDSASSDMSISLCKLKFFPVPNQCCKLKFFSVSLKSVLQDNQLCV